MRGRGGGGGGGEKGEGRGGQVSGWYCCRGPDRPVHLSCPYMEVGTLPAAALTLFRPVDQHVEGGGRRDKPAIIKKADNCHIHTYCIGICTLEHVGAHPAIFAGQHFYRGECGGADRGGGERAKKGGELVRSTQWAKIIRQAAH